MKALLQRQVPTERAHRCLGVGPETAQKQEPLHVQSRVLPSPGGLLTGKVETKASPRPDHVRSTESTE